MEEDKKVMETGSGVAVGLRKREAVFPPHVCTTPGWIDSDGTAVGFH